MPGVDPYGPQPTSSAPSAAGSGIPLPGGVGNKAGTKKIKMSQVVDQMDDTELELLPQADLDDAFRLYRQRVGSEPLKEHEPTPEQIAAMKNKVVNLSEAP